MNSTTGQCHGILLLNKPSGPTSVQCLNKIKKSLGQKKIGHAGTLDPMAEGLLVVLLGQATKLAPYLSCENKTYLGELCLGLETDTYDLQGEITAKKDWQGVQEEKVRQEILSWKELTEQEVPAVSAAKFKGLPLYLRKRKGLEVPQKTKRISIDQIDILDIELPRLVFRVTCSKGTYIRSLAHSLGKRLGPGAVLTRLVREKSSPFSLLQAHNLEDVVENQKDFGKKVIPMTKALPHWPQYTLNPRQFTKLRHGNWLMVQEVIGPEEITPGNRAIFVAPDQEQMALVEARERHGKWYWAILRGFWKN